MRPGAVNESGTFSIAEQTAAAASRRELTAFRYTAVRSGLGISTP